MTTTTTGVFACDMTALTPEQRATHGQTSQALFARIEAIHELPDGYAFRLPTEPAILRQAAEFIACERLCCPFFAFALVVERHGGPAWLHLTGSEGVKPFIQAELGGYLSGALTRQAGWQSV